MLGSGSIAERIRRLHPDADRYLAKAVPWLDRAPLVIVGVGVAWLLLVVLLWIAATAAIVALELDAVLHYLVGAAGVLLILVYVALGVAAWVLAKRLKRELMPARSAESPA